jgi:hypothetical protein
MQMLRDFVGALRGLLVIMGLTGAVALGSYILIDARAPTLIAAAHANHERPMLFNLFTRASKPSADREEIWDSNKGATTAPTALIWHALEHTLESREPSNSELAAALRRAAEVGAVPPARIRALIARRVEEMELALLRMGQLTGDAPPRV